MATRVWGEVLICAVTFYSPLNNAICYAKHVFFHFLYNMKTLIYVQTFHLYEESICYTLLLILWP